MRRLYGFDRLSTGRKPDGSRREERRQRENTGLQGSQVQEAPPPREANQVSPGE